jgi:hypothetical protein
MIDKLWDDYHQDHITNKPDPLKLAVDEVNQASTEAQLRHLKEQSQSSLKEINDLKS